MVGTAVKATRATQPNLNGSVRITWDAVAKRLGIKPGSDAFHALKRGQVDTYRRWGRTIEIDSPVHVDWSRSGPPRAHGNSKSGKGDLKSRGNGNSRGNGGHVDKGNNGNNGRGKGHGKP